MPYYPERLLFCLGRVKLEKQLWLNLSEREYQGHLNILHGMMMNLESCHTWTDCAMGEFELFYLRDKQKREVDFLVVRNKKPYMLVEVKSNQSTPSKSLQYFHEILKPTFTFQLVTQKTQERRSLIKDPNIKNIHIERFLAYLR